MWLKIAISKADNRYQKYVILGKCCVEKFSTLPVCLENKQNTIVPYAVLQWRFNSRKDWLLLLAKAQKGVYFNHLYLNFENGRRCLAIDIVLVKIILFVYNKVAFKGNVLHICYSDFCSCAGMSLYQYVNVISTSRLISC